MTVVSSMVLASVLLTGAAESLQDTPAQRPSVGSRTETDQTVPVQKGARLDLDDCMGEVLVRTWERDAIRVRARHTSRTKVRVDAVGQVVRIDVDSDRGVGIADFELTVPAWINASIKGNNCFIDLEGLAGSISAETVEGDVNLRNLSGTVDVSSVEGQVTVEGGRGRVQINTVEANIRITKAAGEIVADSIEGDITLTDSQSAAVELSTVEGTITYSGTLQPSGRYLFTTHEGDVVLAIPENTSATFGVRSFESGRITTTLPLKQGAAQGRRGQRVVHTLGGGAAQVEIETFEGSVFIRRPGEVQKN
jgi:DUF4097 and DUF4098 domain-containing protein YvlB